MIKGKIKHADKILRFRKRQALDRPTKFMPEINILQQNPMHTKRNSCS